MSADGETLTLWKAKRAIKSIKFFKRLPLLAYKNGSIFAAWENERIIELDTGLNVIKKYESKNKPPVSIDANDDYLAVGWADGSIQVYDRAENDEAKLFWDTIVGSFSFLVLTNFRSSRQVSKTSNKL